MDATTEVIECTGTGADKIPKASYEIAGMNGGFASTYLRDGH